MIELTQGLLVTRTLDIGAIVGGVVGGVVGLALLGAIAFFLWRKKKQPKANVLDEKMVSSDSNAWPTSSDGDSSLL